MCNQKEKRQKMCPKIHCFIGRMQNAFDTIWYWIRIRSISEVDVSLTAKQWHVMMLFQLQWMQMKQFNYFGPVVSNVLTPKLFFSGWHATAGLLRHRNNRNQLTESATHCTCSRLYIALTVQTKQVVLYKRCNMMIDYVTINKKDWGLRQRGLDKVFVSRIHLLATPTACTISPRFVKVDV